MQSTLQLKGVSKKYGDFVALHPTDLAVRKGEFLTLLGPSGSGKTTLLMAIAGFIKPTTGKIALGEQDITSIGPENRNFGVVFQGYALFPHMSVWDNVWFPLRARNISKEQAATAVDEALGMMELTEYAHRRPSELSGGQQQRVALARALVYKPGVLLLDEPLSALDKALRKTLQTELKELHNKVGTTFIYVTHDQEEALSMSDRIAILRRGQIQQIGTPKELYYKPCSYFVAGFLGRTNFIEGQIQQHQGDYVTVETPLGVVKGLNRVQNNGQAGREVLVAIRPEHIMLGDDQPDYDFVAQGKVSDSIFLGDRIDLTVEIAGLSLMALGNSDKAETGQDNWRPNHTVWLGWDAQHALVLDAEGGLEGGHEIED